MLLSCMGVLAVLEEGVARVCCTQAEHPGSVEAALRLLDQHAILVGICAGQAVARVGRDGELSMVQGPYQVRAANATANQNGETMSEWMQAAVLGGFTLIYSAAMYGTFLIPVKDADERINVYTFRGLFIFGFALTAWALTTSWHWWGVPYGSGYSAG